MFSFDGCINKNEIRSKVLIEVVSMRWCASQCAKEVTHSLALHASKIEISAISLSDCFFHKSRPNLNRAIDFLTLHEKQVLLAHRYLHRHEIIHNHISPNPVSADIHRVYPVFIGLLLSEQLQNPRWIFSQDRQCAVKIRVGVFPLGDVSRFAGVDDIDVVVIDARQSLKLQAFLLTEYLLIKDNCAFRWEVAIHKTASIGFLLSNVLFRPFQQAFPRFIRRVMSPNLCGNNQQLQLISVDQLGMLHFGRRLEEPGFLVLVALLVDITGKFHLADIVDLHIDGLEHQGRVLFRVALKGQT